MNVVSRNYFMVRGGHSVHSVIHWFCSTTHPFSFRLSIYLIMVYVCGFILHLVNMSFKNSYSDTPSSDITQSISYVAQSYGLFLLSTHHRCSSTLSGAGYCHSTLHQLFILTLLMIVSYHQYIPNILILFLLFCCPLPV